MDAENVKQILMDALGEHEELWEWIRKLDDGVGTYEEVCKIAELIGDQIVTLMDVPSEELLAAYTEAGHELISMTGIQAQQNLNDAAKIGIKPKTTKYPKAKVQALIDELSLVEPEKISEEVQNAVPSLMMGMVDDIVKYNADFQAKAGLHPIIKRTWSGSYPSHDTKHTDWCYGLAGTYDYDSKMDSRVFARHKGCRCKVEYFPDKNAQGRITALAKGEIDRAGVLWNTRTDTLEKRMKRKK